MLARALTIFGLIVASAQSVPAQAPARTSFVIGAGVAGMSGQFERDNLLGLGLAAGFERQLSPALTVRTSANVLRSVPRLADDIGLCIPAPDDGCLTTEPMPEWLSTLDLSASVALFPAIPVRFYGGFGIALAWQARKSVLPQIDAGAEWSRVRRAGLELPLGSSKNAPRLVISRAWFTNTPYALSRVDGISILFPR